MKVCPYTSVINKYLKSFPSEQSSVHDLRKKVGASFQLGVDSLFPWSGEYCTARTDAVPCPPVCSRTCKSIILLPSLLIVFEHIFLEQYMDWEKSW